MVFSWICNARIGKDDEHTSRRGSQFCSKAFQYKSTIVLTAAQKVSFFEDADQMGLKHRTRVYYIDVEGIENVDNLADWDDDDWDQWASNFKKTDRIQDPNNAANLIAQVPFPLSVKSLKRLNIA